MRSVDGASRTCAGEGRGRLTPCRPLGLFSFDLCRSMKLFTSCTAAAMMPLFF